MFESLDATNDRHHSVGHCFVEISAAISIPASILTIVLSNNTMAIEIPHMKLSHERHDARDLGGNYASLGKGLGARAEPATDPGAILRAKRATEVGKTALVETGYPLHSS